MELSIEQKIAFDKYVEGHNIFITGPGGSGKSELIKKIFVDAHKNYKEIQVCALTGCAAVLLNCKAKTVHSWAGIGLGNGLIHDLIDKIIKKPYLRDTWVNTEILVIDEVSMLSAKLFETLNAIGKAVRRNTRPFGGIQLIFSGDFFQLPPIGDSNDPDSQQFCFESEEWNKIFPSNCQIQLVRIFRQKDEVYTKILNQIRKGKISTKSCDILIKYVGRCVDPTLIIEPTKLFPTRKKAEDINNLRLNSLVGIEKIFTIKNISNAKPPPRINRRVSKTINKKKDELKEVSTDVSTDVLIPPQTLIELEYMAKNLICDKEIKLKIGAQVMCIINIMDEYGQIILCNGSQGIVTGFCSATGFPNVKYNNGLERIMGEHTWLSDKIEGVGVSQVPLILAWALTIHKSQGSTLDAAEIDIGSEIFEYGQTYVALSRIKNLNGLYLSSFDPDKICAYKKVKKYYKGISESDSSLE